MEYFKLNQYILNDKKEEVSKIERLLKKTPITVNEMIEEVKKSEHKNKKLLEISRDITKIMDLYDEDNKININRDVFLKDFLNNIKPFIPSGSESDYATVIDLILSETVQYDTQNWNKVYDNIKKSISLENKEIDKNALYSINYEDLVPKNLIETLKKENNDLIDGGRFSFESCTQEMIGIINEFVLLKGAIATNMYLEQGVKDEIKIKELLKEVNAASLLEPFTFHDGQPRFEKAKSGQFDGFILHRSKAKVLLATKDENTTIEGDSIFRHFVTGMLIKKRIDEAELNQNMVNKKMGEWIHHYTNQNYLDKEVKKIKQERIKIKKIRGDKLTYNDFYVPKDFLLSLNEKLIDAESRDLKVISLERKTNDYILDYEMVKNVLNKDPKKSSTIKFSIEEATNMQKILSSVVKKQEDLKEVLADEGFKKVVENPKFQDQIEIDVKKAEMVKNSEFLSIREMIYYYNKNTREALEEIGILEKPMDQYDYSNRTEFIKSYGENIEKESFNVPELGEEEINKLLYLAENIYSVDLVYYGSVSGKKQAQEYHYNTTEKMKNKEFRYGLNMLAYANILSDSVKDGFTISSDAVLDFADYIQLRTVTKKTKDGFDLDLNKINKKNFLKDVVHVTCKDIYETNKIKDDSVDFYENLFNATNVLLADYLEYIEIEKEDCLNDTSKIDYRDMFSKVMSFKTGRDDEHYDLKKTIETIKEISITKSHKFIHGNSIIETVNNKIEKIIKESNDPELVGILEKYSPKKSDNNRQKRRSRLGR